MSKSRRVGSEAKAIGVMDKERGAPLTSASIGSDRLFDVYSLSLSQLKHARWRHLGEQLYKTNQTPTASVSAKFILADFVFT